MSSTSNKSMDGGWLVREGVTHEQALFDAIKLSDVQPIANSSISGFLFKMTIPNHSTVQSNLISINPGLNQITKELNNFIIKIVLIDFTIKQPEVKDIYVNNVRLYSGNNKPLHKEITPPGIFLDECKTQMDIFVNSKDIYAEPICPMPIFNKIVHKGMQLIDTNIKDKIILELKLKHRLIQNLADNYTFGIIVMENLSDFSPVESFFPGYTLKGNTHENSQSLNSDQSVILDNYLYQLMRLKSLGYIHGDTHLGNAMVCSNYDYIDNYRVYLIDFGRTIRDAHPQNEFNIVSQILNSAGKNFWSYIALSNFFVMKLMKFGTSNKYFYELEQKRTISKNNFIKKLYTDDLLGHFNNLYKNNNLPVIQKDHIFKMNEIPSIIANGSNIDPIYINGICNCFEHDNNYYNYLAPQKSYNQILVKKIFKSKLHQIWENDQLLQQPDGIYLWVIGVTPLKEIKLYTMYVYTCLEIASKHFCIVQQSDICSIYACGELSKQTGRNNNTSISVNLSSGTYMKRYQKLDAFSKNEISVLENIIPTFMEYKLKIGVNMIKGSLENNHTFIDGDFNKSPNNENNKSIDMIVQYSKINSGNFVSSIFNYFKYNEQDKKHLFNFKKFITQHECYNNKPDESLETDPEKGTHNTTPPLSFTSTDSTTSSPYISPASAPYVPHTYVTTPTSLPQTVKTTGGRADVIDRQMDSMGHAPIYSKELQTSVDLDQNKQSELDTLPEQIQDTLPEQIQDTLPEQEISNQDVITNLENEMKMGEQDFGGVQNMKLDYIDSDNTLLDLIHTETNETFKKNANILFNYITETNALAKAIYLDFTTSLLEEDSDIEKNPITGGKRRKKTRHHKRHKKHKHTRRT